LAALRPEKAAKQNTITHYSVVGGLRRKKRAFQLPTLLEWADALPEM
jgi:hypothetical protein